MAAANTVPIFTLTPVVASVACATANTNRDGSGTLATILTGSTYGTRVDRIVCTATVTTTAGMLRFYIDDGGGSDMFLEVPVTAVTGTATVAEWTKTLVFDRGLIIPSGYVLKSSTHNAENFNIMAFGGSY